MAKCAFGQIEFLGRSITSKGNAQILEEHQTADVCEVLTAVHRIRPVLPSIHPMPSRKTCATLQTIAERRQIRINSSS